MGILSGDIKHILSNELQRKFTVHKTGYWMGLHVHDVGYYQDIEDNQSWVALEPNMIFTIELGIYIPANCM
jgi:Xaa-Pro aminopeptidase